MRGDGRAPTGRRPCIKARQERQGSKQRTCAKRQRQRLQLVAPLREDQRGSERGRAGGQERAHVGGGRLGRGRHQPLQLDPVLQLPLRAKPVEEQRALVPGGIGVAVGVAQPGGQPVESRGDDGDVSRGARGVAAQQEVAVQLRLGAAGGRLACSRGAGVGGGETSVCSRRCSPVAVSSRQHSLLSISRSAPSMTRLVSITCSPLRGRSRSAVDASERRPARRSKTRTGSAYRCSMTCSRAAEQQSVHTQGGGEAAYGANQ